MNSQNSTQKLQGERAPNEVPVDLLLTKLKDLKYINAFANPELFPIDKNKGKRQYQDFKVEEAKRIKEVLIDSTINSQGSKNNKLKTRYKDALIIPEEKLRLYEQRLENGFDKDELNRRMKSVSPDNFFKYQDFYGAKVDNISENPTRIHPELKEVYAQK